MPVDIPALAAWMERRGLGRGPILNVELLEGGTQNLLLSFERDGRRYVLRRPPMHPRANSNETMRREMRLLAALVHTTVPHPGLIAASPEDNVLGAAFYLMERIDGFNPTIGLPPLHAASADLRRRMGFSMVEGIAALGALDHKSLGLEDFGKAEGYLERQVPRWRAQLESYGRYADWPGISQLPDIEHIASWLDRHRPSHFLPGIIHGDYHLANVMFQNDRPELAAIVDWELATIGDPLIDLGWLIATWPEDRHDAVSAVAVTPWEGFPTAAELVEHYRPRTMRNLSHIDWYVVLASFKLGILLEGTHARASAGEAPKATGDMLHARSVSLLERARRRIA